MFIGLGLFAKADIEQEQFIMEYVGEVITNEMLNKRIVTSEHQYFMKLTSKELIDATEFSNESRFMNHSCDPNCEMQKWLVDGETCIGLFAVKQIARGTELTFDYNFESFGDKYKKECLCGTKNYRHYIDKTRI